MAAERARVAVVVPCYDDGATLPDTLASLAGQEPHELVVVDDGSVDPGTTRLLASLEAGGTRVVRQANAGLSAARMAGVAATSAPYVLPLDADDALAPGSLAALADALDADPHAAVAWGDVELWGAFELLLRTGETLDPWQITYLNTLPVAALVRREALLEVGGWQLLYGYEDWDVWMGLAERGFGGRHVARPTLRYRRRAGRMLTGTMARHSEIVADLRRRHPAALRRPPAELAALERAAAGPAPLSGDLAPASVRPPEAGALPARRPAAAVPRGPAPPPPRRPGGGRVSRPRVTVLLAVKDGEPWIRRAVESVLGQTFADFELLVVDDGSSDSTAATVESFADPRVRLLRNAENLGQVPSLNLGLREARGEYVARLDHDDWCAPNRLERQVAVLDAEPGVGLVGSWLRVVDEDDRTIGRMEAALDDFAELVYATLIMQVLVTHPASMYRREPVLELGGYDEATGPAEDKDLWRKLVLARWDARIVPEPLLSYRVHGRQLSQTRAEHQRRVDGESQERFLAALAAEAPVRAVRLLLADDPGFWREHGSAEAARAALAGVGAVLAGARSRLALEPAEAAKLEALVRARVADVARRGWRHDLRGWQAAAPALGETAWPRAAAAPVAQPREAGSRELVARAGASVAPLRGPARRSRLVRALYSRVAGGR